MDYEELDFSSVRSTWIGVRDSLDDVLERKKESPLNAIGMGQDIVSNIHQYKVIENKVEKYNKKIKTVNNKIEQIRESTMDGDVREEKEKLSRIYDVRKRYGKDEVIRMCEYFEKKKSKKNSLKEKLEKVRE